ncbi:MAG: 4Fe-4S binding protein [Endomicrobium sp.]|jgi:2-oxoglutarate ferredoxin oxidoreductase subunit delta|nr:4Fe-4S binding protein [Endomicrobium sp.]
MGSMIKIFKEKCKGCGLCIEFCPNKCISFSKRFNKLGYHWAIIKKSENNCTGCGFCFTICPDICIETYETEIKK